jgi:hypothetical protein
MSSEGFSALEKNTVICPKRAVLPIQSGTRAHFFKILTLQGRVWEPSADDMAFCCTSNLKKKLTNQVTPCSFNPLPDGPLAPPLTDGPRSDWTEQKTGFDDVS